MQVSEQGFVGLQLGIGFGILDKSKKVHLLQAKVYILRHISVRKDRVLEIHNHIQAPKGEPGVPGLPHFQIL